MKYKIFDEENIQVAIDKAFEEGYDIADLEQCIQYKKKFKFDERLSTSTVWLNCNPRSATHAELKNMKQFYEKGGRWLVLGFYIFNDQFYGSYFVNIGRVLGVKK